MKKSVDFFITGKPSNSASGRLASAYTKTLKSLLLTAAIVVFLAQNGLAANTIAIDGSSTVYPITEAVAEEFGFKNRSARITIGVSGSGGGFKKFCRGETAISDASRPIKKVEMELCAKNGIQFIELPVAYDGIAIVVNKKNNWADTITVDELKRLWEPKAEGVVAKWSQIRKGWPDKKIILFGPGVDSGTFDYFTEAIVGKSHASRADFTSSEDDNVLVRGVAMEKYALGFFGLAYYVENKNKLNLLAVDGGSGPVKPSARTVGNGTYAPLSRPLFIYVNKKSAGRPEVGKFVRFYLKNMKSLADEVGYVSLPDKITALASRRFEAGIVGSMYVGKKSVGVSLESLLKK